MTDFGELYATYARDVLRFALYLSGNQSDAEDITSETFVRAWTATLPTAAATLKSYLLTIARNEYLQGVRRTARSVALDRDFVDNAPGPETIAIGKAELTATLAALQQLPELDRAAVLLRAFDALAYEEIARVLDISVTAAKVKVHRARAKLARLE